MIRTLYALCVAALIGSTGWAATGLKTERPDAGNGMGIVILAAL